jgi:L-alanine-DL-glutamate epimerase-like enolase superfamily enzyme
VKVEIAVRQAPLGEPLQSAHGRTASRPLVLLRLSDADGVVGHGEAAPLESYDGVTLARTLEELERARVHLERDEPLPPDILPQARAAVDLALWDRAGRLAGQPVWRLLRARSRDTLVPVNATIGAETPEVAARAAAAARAAGYPLVKVKVGGGSIEADRERVRAVREAAGPELLIRLDANGAWSVPEAIEALRALQSLDLEACEEPVHGVSALAEVALATEVPVLADETSADRRLFERRVCTGVCLKIVASGGITGVLRDAERARELGYEVNLASTLDGPLGIAAALHAAAAVVPDRPSGLATLGRFEAPDPLPARGGRMVAPGDPGLLSAALIDEAYSG